MGKLTDKILREGLFDALDSIPDDQWKEAYIARINRDRDGLLEKVIHNPDFRFELGKNVKSIAYGDYNKCETNAFNFVKEQLSKGETNFFPVGGYGFTHKGLFPVGHWWVYDSSSDKFVEVTPLRGEPFQCYGGIIRKDLQEQIIKAEKYYDVDFFKGGHVYYKYIK